MKIQRNQISTESSLVAGVVLSSVCLFLMPMAFIFRPAIIPIQSIAQPTTEKVSLKSAEINLVNVVSAFILQTCQIQDLRYRHQMILLDKNNLNHGHRHFPARIRAIC
jgi:hypothetical protein